MCGIVQLREDMRVFDLDHTLITSNVSVDFGRYLYRRRRISRLKLTQLIFWYSRHKFLGLSVQALHEAVFVHLFKGMLFSTLLQEVDQFFKDSPPDLFAPLTPFIQEDSLLLSSSPDFLVAPLCKILAINNFRASTYAVDKEGKLCHISEVMEGCLKAEKLTLIAQEMKIGKEEITYFTDSIIDAPVFEVVGKVVAVCPDRKLKRLAEQNRWEIIHETTLFGSC